MKLLNFTHIVFIAISYSSLVNAFCLYEDATIAEQERILNEIARKHKENKEKKSKAKAGGSEHGAAAAAAAVAGFATQSIAPVTRHAPSSWRTGMDEANKDLAIKPGESPDEHKARFLKYSQDSIKDLIAEQKSQQRPPSNATDASSHTALTTPAPSPRSSSSSSSSARTSSQTGSGRGAPFMLPLEPDALSANAQMATQIALDMAAANHTATSSSTAMPTMIRTVAESGRSSSSTKNPRFTSNPRLHGFDQGDITCIARSVINESSLDSDEDDGIAQFQAKENAAHAQSSSVATIPVSSSTRGFSAANAVASLGAAAKASAVSAPVQVGPLRRITIFAEPRPGEHQPRELLITALPLSTTMSSLRVSLDEQLRQRFPNRVVRFCGVSKAKDRLMPIDAHSEVEKAVTVGDLPIYEEAQPVYKNDTFVGLEKIAVAALMVEIDPAQDQEHQLRMIRDSLAPAAPTQSPSSLAPLQRVLVSAHTYPSDAPAQTTMQRHPRLIRPIALRPVAAARAQPAAAAAAVATRDQLD